MPETVLVNDEVNDPNMQSASIEAAQESDDWDGDRAFKDVSDNDYLMQMFEDEA